MRKRMKVHMATNMTTEWTNYATFRAKLDKETRNRCYIIKGIEAKQKRKEVDEGSKKVLVEYIERTPFEEIRANIKHKESIRRLIYKTKSNSKICYWCLSEECFHRRRFHTTLENLTEDRLTLDEKTLQSCPVYRRKLEQALRKGEIAKSGDFYTRWVKPYYEEGQKW